MKQIERICADIFNGTLMTLIGRMGADFFELER
jgi:hypothetical protein